MGAVYKAPDLNLNRLVAIKLLSANAAASLNHPNIITVYEIESGGNDPFIALEYVDGKTLDHLIGRLGMPLDEARGYAAGARQRSNFRMPGHSYP